MKHTFSKIDSARLQIDQAISLYFYDSDVVSIHTLTQAARGILSNLLNRANKKSSEDLFIDQVKSQYRKRMRILLRKHQNYFKHAEVDTDALIEFNDEINDLIIFSAVNDFRELTGIVSENIDVYALWYITHNPNMIIMPNTPEIVEWAAKLKKEAQKLDKKFYFENIRTLPSADKVFPYFYRTAG